MLYYAPFFSKFFFYDKSFTEKILPTIYRKGNVFCVGNCFSRIGKLTQVYWDENTKNSNRVSAISLASNMNPLLSILVNKRDLPKGENTYDLSQVSYEELKPVDIADLKLESTSWNPRLSEFDKNTAEVVEYNFSDVSFKDNSLYIRGAEILRISDYMETSMIPIECICDYYIYKRELEDLIMNKDYMKKIRFNNVQQQRFYDVTLILSEIRMGDDSYGYYQDLLKKEGNKINENILGNLEGNIAISWSDNNYFKLLERFYLKRKGIDLRKCPEKILFGELRKKYLNYLKSFTTIKEVKSEYKIGSSIRFVSEDTEDLGFSHNLSKIEFFPSSYLRYDLLVAMLYHFNYHHRTSPYEDYILTKTYLKPKWSMAMLQCMTSFGELKEEFYYVDNNPLISFSKQLSTNISKDYNIEDDVSNL